MKHKLFAPVAAVVAIFGALLIPNNVHAAGGIYFSPASPTVNVGSNFTVTVRANPSGNGATAAQVTLNYDGSKLQFVSLSAGPLMNQGANYANSGSTISGGAYNTTPQTADFAMLSVTFKALAGSGSTTLDLVTTGAYGTDVFAGADSIGPSISDGTVTFATPTCAAGQTGTWPNCVTPTTPTPTNPKPTSPTPTAPKPSSPSAPKPNTPSAPATSTPSTPNTPETPTTETPTDITTDSDTISKLRIGVFDKNHKPLKNKKVTLHSDPQTATTDKNGYATFTNVPIGSHSLEYTDARTKKSYKSTLVLASADTRTVVLDYAQPSYTWLWWLVLLVVLLGAAALVYSLMRRKGSSAPAVVGGFGLHPEGIGSATETGSSSNNENSSDEDLITKLDRIKSNAPLPLGTVVEPDGQKKFPEENK